MKENALARFHSNTSNIYVAGSNICRSAIQTERVIECPCEQCLTQQ